VPFEDLLVLWSLRFDDEDTFYEELAASRVYRESRGTLGYVPDRWEGHRSPFDHFDVRLWILARAGGPSDMPSGGKLTYERDGTFYGSGPWYEWLLRAEREMGEEFRQEDAALKRLIPATMPAGWEGHLRYHELKSLADLKGYLDYELSLLRSNVIGAEYQHGDDVVAAHQAWRNAWRVFDDLEIVDRPERGDDPGPPLDIERRLSELILWLRKQSADNTSAKDDGNWLGPKTRGQWAKEFDVDPDTVSRWKREGLITQPARGRMFYIRADSAATAGRQNGDVHRHSATNGDATPVAR
jgi:hypothetical protein